VSAIAEFFNEGGFWMWPVSFFGMTAFALGVLAVSSRNRTMTLSALGVSCAVVFLGVTGTMLSRMQVKQAVAMIKPTYRDGVLEQGFKEANRPLQLAGGFALLGLLMGGVAFPLSKRA
jgi:hypothetical protein